MKFVENLMNFHFANKNYLRKVDSFRVISEKPPKNENYHLFYNVASRNFGEIWIKQPKKSCKKSQLPQNVPDKNTI